MYALKPLASNSLSQTPNTGEYNDVNIDNVTHRIVPVNAVLDFSDVISREYTMMRIEKHYGW